MNVLTGIIHGIDYALSCGLLGLVVFYVFIVTAGGHKARDLLGDFANQFRMFALLTLVSTTVFSALSIESITESWALRDLWNGFAITSFGHLWCIRIVMLAMLMFATFRFPKSRMGISALIGWIVAILLLSVLSGHSGSQNNSFILRAATDWTHAMAVGVWSGGLWLLYVWLGRRLGKPEFDASASQPVVKRFSLFAMCSTGFILMTGILTALLSGVSILAPWSSQYGCLVALKIGLFGGALLAASFNQFIHLRHWIPENEIVCVSSIRREVLIEVVILAVVFIVVGFLTRTALPGEV